MTARAAARQRQRRVNARWRAAALPVSYTTRRDMTHLPRLAPGAGGPIAGVPLPRRG
jgi:hypothetical protein